MLSGRKVITLTLMLVIITVLSANASALFPTLSLHSSGMIHYSDAKKLFGAQVWYHPQYDAEIRQTLPDLGVGWVRLDCRWDTIESSKGNFNWGNLDIAINSVRSVDVKPLVVLATETTPSWANGGAGGREPPTNVDDFGDFVEAVVSRYGLDVIEVLNEPAVFSDATEEEWVHLTKAGCDGARRANPDILCIGAYGWGPINNIYTQWMALNRLQAYTVDGQKFLDFVDALAVHPYTWSDNPETGGSVVGDSIPVQLKQLRDYLTSQGYPDKPLWATEFGYKITLGEQTQADYTIKLCQILWNDSYVEMINYYDLRGTDWSLCNSDFTPRQVYYTYKDFIATH